jgi:hypothetical protein
VCASLPTFLLCSVLRLPRLSDLCPALQGKHTNSEPRADDATHGTEEGAAAAPQHLRRPASGPRPPHAPPLQPGGATRSLPPSCSFAASSAMALASLVLGTYVKPSKLACWAAFRCDALTSESTGCWLVKALWKLCVSSYAQPVGPVSPAALKGGRARCACPPRWPSWT